MSQLVAVAGGTGLVGRLVVDLVRAGGDEARVLSRATDVDLTTGRGLAGALAGVDTVIDVTNVRTTSRTKSVAFFDAVAQHLAAAEHDAGVGRHVLLSIVGVDRVDFGYYLGKRRQEQVVRTGVVPWSLLRATQFHEFPSQLAAGRGPVAAVPRMRSRTIAAHEVAEHLVGLGRAAPTGEVTELAGPQVHEMPELTRRWLQAMGSRRRVLPVRLPGSVGRAMADGALLPSSSARYGSQTFDEWLDEQHRPQRGHRPPATR